MFGGAHQAWGQRHNSLFHLFTFEKPQRHFALGPSARFHVVHVVAKSRQEGEPDRSVTVLFDVEDALGRDSKIIIRFQHQPQPMSIADAAEWLKNYQMEIAAVKAVQTREAGEKYLADNAQRAEVAVTNSGLQYEILTPTEGPKPEATDTVRVHYRGTSIDGTEFDSSYSRNAPASFPLNRVIPGWTEGLQLMAVGSKFRFVIPSGLAYGERGSGRSIGPGETLIFIVELLDINPA